MICTERINKMLGYRSSHDNLYQGRFIRVNLNVYCIDTNFYKGTHTIWHFVFFLTEKDVEKIMLYYKNQQTK